MDQLRNALLLRADAVIEESRKLRKESQELKVETFLVTSGIIDQIYTIRLRRIEQQERRMETKGEFSVVQFFPDDSYHYVRRFVSQETAVKVTMHYIANVAARLGVTQKVIITNGGDETIFMWEAKKGIVFPPEVAEQYEGQFVYGGANGVGNLA